MIIIYSDISFEGVNFLTFKYKTEDFLAVQENGT